MNTIEQTNAPVWAAVAAVRIDRNPLTMNQLYHAINRRRNARNYRMPDWIRAAWEHEQAQDLRAYGQVERTHAELADAVALHRPRLGFVTK